MNTIKEKLVALRNEINRCGIVQPNKLAKGDYSTILDSIHEKLCQNALMILPMNSNIQTHIIYGVASADEMIRKRTRVTAEVDFFWIDVESGESYGPFHGIGEAKADFEDAAVRAFDVAEWNHLSSILSLTCD